MSLLVGVPAGHSELSVLGREGWVNSRLASAHGHPNSPSSMGRVALGLEKARRTTVRVLCPHLSSPGLWTWTQGGPG